MDDATRRAIVAGRQAGLAYAMLRPQRTTAGFLGEQLGSGVGNSIEFMDYREYAPGDDLRRIDWAAYARSDRLVVKLHREEVSPHLDLIVDASASMQLEHTDKAAATLGVAAALSAASDNSRMTRRVFSAGDRLKPIMHGDGDPLTWAWPGFDCRRSLTDGLLNPGLPLRRRGIRILLSDLLYADDPTPIMNHLAENAAAVYVVQLLARQDVSPDWNGDVRLVDAESGMVHEVRLDAGALARYHEHLSNLREQWRAACHRVNAQLIELVAEDVTTTWDLGRLAQAGVLRVA